MLTWGSWLEAKHGIIDACKWKTRHAQYVEWGQKGCATQHGRKRQQWVHYNAGRALLKRELLLWSMLTWGSCLEAKHGIIDACKWKTRHAQYVEWGQKGCATQRGRKRQQWVHYNAGRALLKRELLLWTMLTWGSCLEAKHESSDACKWETRHAQLDYVEWGKRVCIFSTSVMHTAAFSNDCANLAMQIKFAKAIGMFTM